MRGPRTIVPTVLCVLLLASAAGWVGHEHQATGRGAPAVDAMAWDCALDHRAATSASPPAAPLVEPRGRGHRHHCVGCQLNGQRSAGVAPPRHAGSLEGSAGAVAAVAGPRPFRLPPRAVAPRGPPTVASPLPS